MVDEHQPPGRGGHGEDDGGTDDAARLATDDLGDLRDLDDLGDSTDDVTGSVADGVARSLAPAHVTVSRLGGLVAVVVFGVPVWLAVLLVVVLAPAPTLVDVLLLSVSGSLTAFFLFWSLWWPRRKWFRTRYRTDSRGFTIRRGVVWRRTTSIPKARVQHTDVVQGPLQRHFGIGRLVIHTAGTQDSSVSLSGLEHERALAIRDYLIEGDEPGGV